MNSCLNMALLQQEYNEAELFLSVDKKKAKMR